ncbi:electron transport complex subunit RsxD [Exilibacterium tricleocarpae]|uniref:Ion-translocating oxidoreductase complex subunit D n=1 Tax=Exilibacterium tricleocarpae TaxID=2591008 RepID=A0A545U5J0_9GAMM|nr:electron transport complex subunit RsxD [Exilibacterium tricleocarpae]TQV84732.1 electron transport complex subunit RsxD [Exilibacterium tricleocarpae]
MALMRITSPHAHSPGDTGDVMRQVIFATIPGLIALSYFFGPGSLMNVIMASFTAVVCEAAVMKLRRRPIAFYLNDYSAVVTGVLLGLALPPYCPWWIVAVGTASAILVAKHLYGGMGYNPFNPAMVGYVVVLISFPVEMTQWAAPRTALTEGQSLLGPLAALQTIWLDAAIDGYTGATPLDVFKQNNSQLVQHLYATEPVFASGRWAGAGWEWANIGFLLGGAYLLYRRIFTWHAPVATLTVLIVLSTLFYDGGSSTSGGSPLLHLLSGGTMLGAFFIVTDPVTSAVSNRGRLIYGAGVGALIYIIRTWGNYPDAVAFAVLLMNFAAPFIDYYTLPRTYGHEKPRRATETEE